MVTRSPMLHSATTKDISYSLLETFETETAHPITLYKGKGKLLHLQGIRGLAICSVIAFHYFPGYFPNGYLGVDIFFVLSGYLMSMLLSKNSGLDARSVVDFLYRRIKRITPLYYLVALLTMGILQFCPCTELGNNLLTARSAIWLLSNTNWDTGMGYFEKSGLSHDLFTHTWSLCLEMQFYLLFPFLWWTQIQFSANRRMVILHIISGFSFVLYLMSEERAAFNSVLCRIWQFLLGNMVYYLENNSEHSLEEYMPLTGDALRESKILSKKVATMEWIFASLSVIVLIYTMAVEIQLFNNYSRITTTLLSVFLIYFGKGFHVLENGVIVFLGEISYSWYLVHWPMVVVQKIFDYTSEEEMLFGGFASLTTAVVLHYGVEKFYLAWKKRTVYVTVILLFLGCNNLYYYLSRMSILYSFIMAVPDTRLKICQKSPIMMTDFSSMAIEERQAYNVNLSNYDNYQILNEGCEFEPSLQSYVLAAPSFEGTCKYKNDEAQGNRTILVMGNSWAANIVPIVFDECKPFFANIYRTSYIDGVDCPQREQAYLKSVEKIEPDYLFLTYRYCFFGLFHTEAEWKDIMRVASERLAYLVPLVKEKIFILHTFPFVATTPAKINAAMANNSDVDWDVSKKNGIDMLSAQKKLDELIRNCPKCEEINLEPSFMSNGKFTPYDTKYYIAYITQGTHFSLLGLEKIRPVYSEDEWKLFAEEHKKWDKKYGSVRKNILILTVVEGGSNLTEYAKALDTVECYAKIQGYARKFVLDSDYNHRCHQEDKFFRRHCIAAILLENYDYLLFLDADAGIVNPKRRIEEYIDDRYDVFLYDRIYNQEIAAGSYIVKNTPYAKKFLNDFSDQENRLYYNSLHGTDNGVLHLYLAEILFGRGNEFIRICTDIYRNSQNYYVLFSYEACIRGVLGRWSQFEKIKIFRKGRGWVRDGWATNALWSPRRDLFTHDWKQKNERNYTRCDLPLDITYRVHGIFRDPLKGGIDLDLCVPGNMTWNYDYNLVRTADDIDAEISRKEYFIEQEKYRFLATIREILGF